MNKLFRPTLVAAALALAGWSAHAADLPGKGISVLPLKSSIAEETFQTLLVMKALEQLGYEVQPIKEVEYPTAHVAIGNGDATFLADHWNPLHADYFKNAGGEAKHGLEIASGAIALAGILLAALLFLGKRTFATTVAQSAPGRFLSAWWFAAWGFDCLYDKLFVQPYLLICRLLGRDPIDLSIGLVPRLARGGNALLARSQTGQVRWYATSIAGGAVLVLAALLFLS